MWKRITRINAGKYVFDVCNNTDSIGSQESPEDLHPNNLINLSIHINLNNDEAEVLHDLLERDVDLTIIYNRVMWVRLH